MIKKIELLNVASYSKEEKELFAPLKINYFYGCNGSGKSTVANYLNNITDSKYSTCSVEWENNNPNEVLVYNNDFVKENFALSSEIKGIFTLGKTTSDALKFIEEGRENVKKINNNLHGARNKLEEFNDSLRNLIEDYQNIFWKAKTTYAPDFGKAMQGFLGKKSDFFSKCLSEYGTRHVISETKEELLNRYKKVFESDIKEYPLLNDLDLSLVSLNETCDLLDKVISGKEDLPIGGLISKLSNSDWIKQGLGYLSDSDDKCPFCQRTIPDELKEEIESFFDTTYENNCNDIKSFKNKYVNYFSTLIFGVKTIAFDDFAVVDFKSCHSLITTIEDIYKRNIELLDSKISMPSTKVYLTSLYLPFEALKNEINKLNAEILKNNEICKNLAKERKNIVDSVWQIIIKELELSIESFNKQKGDLEKAISSLYGVIKTHTENLDKLTEEIKVKEASMTSIEYTVNEINKILTTFGFTGFKLNTTAKKGRYKIERPDGEDAKDTLSEGEYRFITFLYFYQLLKGSFDSSGLLTEKVVVIDDPVSSLDSNSLFIISTLTKDIIARCLDDKDGINQVFLLTHNIYFHKEITFKGARETASPNKEAYWIIQKSNNLSKIKRFKSNPILTTYESLWRMLDDTSNIADMSVLLNAMRRILEHYFNVICGYDYEKCVSNFEGEDKLVCKALLSYINDGSHFISDDYVLCYDSIDKYLRVFEKIFDNLGHINHYKAMSGEDRRWKFI